MKSLLKKLLVSRRLEYLILDQNLLIQEMSFGVKQFANHPDQVSWGKDVRLGFPQLIGVESFLIDVIEGRQVSFELKGIERSSEQLPSQYLDICIVEAQDEESVSNKLLILFEDASERIFLKQSLFERGNETLILLNALASSKKYVNKIIASMADALIVTTRLGTIKKINPAAQRLFGYSESDLMGQSISKLIANEALWQTTSECSVGCHGEIFKDIEVVCSTKNQEKILVSFSCSSLPTEPESSEDFVYIGRDLTERKAAEIAVAKMNSELAKRVEAQTLELRQTIQRLENEISSRQQIESALRESESRLSNLLNSLQDVVWSVAASTFEALYLNPATETLYGRPVVEFYYNPYLWLEVIHPEDRDRVANLFSTVLEIGNVEMEYRIIRPDAELRWVNNRVQLIKDEAGEAIRIDGIITDITERKRAETALKNIVTGTASVTGEEFFPVLVQHLATSLGVRYAAVCEITENLPQKLQTIAFWNGEKLAQNVEYEISHSPCEIVHKQKRVCVYPDRVQDYFPLDQDLANLGAVSYLGVPLLDSAQNTIGNLWIIDNKPLLDEQRTRSVMNVFAARAAAELERKEAVFALRKSRDELEIRVQERTAELIATNQSLEAEIAYRVQAEAALRESEYRYQTLANLSPVGIFHTDSWGRCLYVNHRWCEISGIPAPVALGDDWTGAIHPDDRARIKANWYRCTQEYLPFDAETRFQRPDGSISSVFVQAVAQLGNDGTLVGYIGTVTDINYRVQAEEALRRSAAEIHDLYNNAPCGYQSLDSEGRFIRVNDTELKLLGYTRDELIGRKFIELLTPDSKQVFRKVFPRFKQRGWMQDLELELSCKDGTLVPVSLSGTTLRDAAGNFIMTRSTIFDITERKRAEAALRESQERFRSAFEYSTIGMALVAPDGRWLQVNPALCEILGYAAEELLSLTFQDITHPNDLEIDQDCIYRITLGEIGTYQMEKRYIHKLGQSVWVLLSVSAVRDSDSQLLYLIAQIQDITERKQAEQALKERERRIRRHQEGLMALAKCESLYTGDLSAALQNITQIAAIALRVERVGIWFYNEDRSHICCADLYEFSTLVHTSGSEIAVTDYPSYFEALEADSIIAADDARTDFQTQELATSYLIPLGITSILDVPIRIGGQTVGVICHDHVGNPRTWALEEQNFASYLAYMASLAIESRDRAQAEQALLIAQERLQYLLTSSPAVIYSCKSSNSFDPTFISENISTLVGYEAREFLENRSFWRNHIHPEDRQRVFTALPRLFEQGHHCHEYRFQHQNGSYRWMHDEVKLVRDKAGNPLELIGYWADITERKQAEADLAKSLSLLQATFDSTTDGILVVDRQGKITTFNRKFQEMWRIPDEVLASRDEAVVLMFVLDQLKVPETFLEKTQKLHSQKTAETYDLLEFKDGRMFERYSMPQQLGEKIVGRVSTFRDITARKRAEAILAKRDRYLAALVEVQLRLLADDGDGNSYAQLLEPLGRASGASRVYVFENQRDESGHLLMSQRAEWCASSIHPEISNRALQNLFNDQFFPRWAKMLTQGEIIAGKVSEFPESERRILEPQGICSVLILPMLVDDQFFGFIGFDDCTSPRIWEPLEIDLLRSAAAAISLRQERKQAEAALETSENKYRYVVENLREVIFQRDVRGCWTFLNPAWTEITNYSIEESLGHHFLEFIHPDDHHLTLEHFNALMSREIDSSRYEVRCRTKDGSYRWVEVQGRVNIAANGTFLGSSGTLNDITDRKRIEQAIEQERQQLRQIITNAPVAIAMFDTEMRYIAHSNQWLVDNHLMGQSLIGRSHYEIFPHQPAEFKTIHQRALNGEVLSKPEDVWEQPDGAKIYLRWAVQPWYSGHRTSDCSITGAQKQEFSDRQCLTPPAPGAPPHDQIGGVVIVTQMINELVEAREAALEASRMKSQFLANMSHEIRTPMNAVIGLTDLLLRTPLNAKQQDFVQTLKVSGQNLLMLINDILDFSKLEAGEMRLEMIDFNLNICVAEIVDLLTAQAQSKGLELFSLIDSKVSRQLRGDATRLRQVLMNLIGNAIKFTPAGEIVVQVEMCHEGEGGQGNFISHLPPCPPAPTPVKLRFCVRDTGIGIASEDMDKLFRSFSQVDASTTRQYGGTGLGLAICKQLVELMGGEIGVESQPGVGSTFWFTAIFELPPDSEPPSVPLTLECSSSSMIGSRSTVISPREQAHPFPMTDDPLPNNLKILLVEDTPVNQKVALNQLKVLGYEADCVSNGKEALDRLAKTDYDIVLMDCLMPVLDGYKTTQAIREKEGQSRHTIVIAMTANALKGDREKCIAAGMDDYISKPINLDALAAVLNRYAQLDEDLVETRILASSLGENIDSSSHQPPSPTSLETPVDLERLNELSRGDTEFQLELLQTFMEDAPTYLTEIKLALQANDWVALARRAHQLKGGSAMVAIRTMPELAQQLESQAEEHDIEQATELITQLEIILEQVKAFIENWSLVSRK